MGYDQRGTENERKEKRGWKLYLTVFTAPYGTHHFSFSVRSLYVLYFFTLLMEHICTLACLHLFDLCVCVCAYTCLNVEQAKPAVKTDRPQG